MTPEKQKEFAQENLQLSRAQPPQKRHSSQPKRIKRAKPGTTGEGDYFRITVRPKEEFSTFRYQDIGEKGHIQRLAGRRSNGSWDTQVWLIGKEDGHFEGDALIPDTEDARRLIERLGSKPMHVKEDDFEAKDRPSVPENEKPTEAQHKARLENIKKPNKLGGHAYPRKRKSYEGVSV